MRSQMETTLLLHVWLCKYSSCHNHGARDPPLNPGIVGTRILDQNVVPAIRTPAMGSISTGDQCEGV